MRGTHVILGNPPPQALVVSADYKWSLYGLDPETPHYRRIMKKVGHAHCPLLPSCDHVTCVACNFCVKVEEGLLYSLSIQVHVRSAERLRDVCSRNGGLFIKVGQHVGSMDYLLPQEYVQAFKVFHSDAPQTPLHRMKQVIREELGQSGTCSGGCSANALTAPSPPSLLPSLLPSSLPPSLPPAPAAEEVFAELGEEPLGAASLAQCHRGVLKNGLVVAVKIQHPDVLANAYSDMDTMDVSSSWSRLC